MTSKVVKLPLESGNRDNIMMILTLKPGYLNFIAPYSNDNRSMVWLI